jgi:acetyl esterase/lipase
LTAYRFDHHNDGMKPFPLFFATFAVALFLCTPLRAADLPRELPLWKQQPMEHPIRYDVEEGVRSPKPPSGSPSGSNRVFSFVSSPTYSIHRPGEPNGVGLVICPGGGYRDVWLDREGHDLAIWLKDHGVTSLVLKYRTNSGDDNDRAYSWEDYLPAVQADARQAIRILRKDASDLGLQPNKIGICGFSAGGNLALISTLYSEPKQTITEVSGMPDFAGLFYPWFRDDHSQIIKSRTAPESATRGICPIFIMNASDDQVTPANKCVDFYATLLKAGVKTELHVFSKGSHGFDLGTGRGESAATWPTSFVAWLRDSNMIED